jgi:cold shock CspA family protein
MRMDYETNDRVLATLVNAPKGGEGANGFGFAQPLEGGPEIYLAPDALRQSGLTRADIGCRVVLTMQSVSYGKPAYAIIVERDDSEIEGEEPDVIELAILRRLHKIERMIARLTVGEARDV